MKKLIITLFCAFLTLGLSAQPGSQNDQGRHQFSPERYKQKLEEYVTREAGLTSEESSRLFPLLHEMQEKQRKNSEAAGNAMRSCKEGATESDYEKAVNRAVSLDLENKKIEQEYYKKFHTVLSWKKIHAVRIALWKFQMEALRRFTPHNGNKHNEGQRGRRHAPQHNGQKHE